MDWKDVGEAVKKYAPMLGTAIGGPAGTAAGGAVSLILSAFGLGHDAAPDQVVEAIKADPQAALKLKEIEANNRVELERLNLQRDQAYLADRQGARNREVEITKATGKRDINLYILAWVIVAGFFLLTALLVYRPVAEGSSQVVFLLFGALAAGFGTVLQYFFGSSQSSDIKTKLMAGGGKDA